MGAMDDLKTDNEVISSLFEAKQARRKKLSRLSFPEKVKAVIQLQAMAAPILRRRGKLVHVWKVDGV